MADYIIATIEIALHRLIATPLHAVTIAWPEVIAAVLAIAIAAFGQWRAKRWPIVVLCVILLWLLARRLAGR